MFMITRGFWEKGSHVGWREEQRSHGQEIDSGYRQEAL